MSVNPIAADPKREASLPMTTSEKTHTVILPAVPVYRETPSQHAPATEVAFEVSDLSCWFGQLQAVCDLNLRIPARAVTAIIGPSGCGKSTFLRSLNRMHELVRGSRLSGQIRLFGEDIYGPRIDA